MCGQRTLRSHEVFRSVIEAAVPLRPEAATWRESSPALCDGASYRVQITSRPGLDQEPGDPGETDATDGSRDADRGQWCAPHVAQAPQPGSRRTDLQRHDLSAPGREVVQVRVDFDPGYVSPKHTHPGEEIIYILEGTLEYEIGSKPPVRVQAGDVLFVPAGTIHSAKNIGSGNGAELATYVVEKGKPLINLTK